MPNYPRPAKSAGNTNYADEVAAGVPDIIDAEVDLDFNTLYNALKGGLDDDNINTTLALKKIAYEKLNLTGKVKNSDIVGPIDASKISGSGGTAFDGASIKPGSITWDKLVSLASLGGSQPPQWKTGIGPVGNPGFPGNATDLVLDSIAFHVYRGVVVCQASIGMEWPTQLFSGAAQGLLTGRIWAGSVGGRLVAERSLQCDVDSSGSLGNPVLHLLALDIAPVGTTTYYFTLTCASSYGGSSRYYNFMLHEPS